MAQRKTTEKYDLETIRKGFETFDVDGTGRIFPEELLEVMDSMNMKDKNPYIYEIIESLCSEKEYKIKGGVSLDELVNYVYEKLNVENDEGIRENFDVINNRDDDTVSMSTFESLSKNYGDNLEEDEIRYLLEKTQMGGEELNYDEFHTIMKGAKRSNTRPNNNYNFNTVNSVSSRKSNNKVYEKKNNQTISTKNSNDMSKRIRSKYLYNEQSQTNKTNPEKEIVTMTSKTTTINIKTNNNNTNNIINNVENIINNNNNNNDINDINIDDNNFDNNSQKYSYRRVKINQKSPQYDIEIEKHYSENQIPNINDLNINNDMDKNDKYEKETKITHLPDGSKQIEVIEKSEKFIEDVPISNSFNFERPDTEEKNESKTVYKIRRPKTNYERNEEIYTKVLETTEEKTDGAPKRYHRRYREYKTSTADANEK